MKNSIKSAALIALLSIGAFTAKAQAYSAGDFAFTAFNADEDGFSLVTFVTVTPNSTFFFNDGVAAGPFAVGSTESGFQWVTGSQAINPGTVIRFSATDTVSLAASVGTFTNTINTNPGFSATAETLYFFEGTSATVATQMITAVSSQADNTGITVVGLTAGTDAIKLTSSTDFAEYTGARTGLTVAEYRTAINNPANWAINVGGDGALVVPNTTNFEIIPEPSTGLALIGGLSVLVGLRRRRN
jgi:hypothetical protein